MKFAKIAQEQWGGFTSTYKTKFATEKCLEFFKKENPTATITFITKEAFYTTGA